MTHWKLILAYNGTPFHGWQIQPALPTVQGLLADAIHRTVGERVLPQGSGRTDTGVHALGQVASFALQAPIPAANLHHALNRCLPPSIRILSAQAVPPDFHARHSAIRKTYEYRIFPLKSHKPQTPSSRPEATNFTAVVESPPYLAPDSSPSVPEPTLSLAKGLTSEASVHDPICSPILAPYVWPCPWPLDLTALNQAAAHVLGTHDFSSFAASDPDLTARTAIPGQSPGHAPGHDNSIRTISHSSWHTAGGLVLYRVTATGFLHHMVRNLVGTFVQCGAHRLDPDSIPAVLAVRNRSAAGPTAPSTGLFLLNVEYSGVDRLQPTTDTLQPTNSQ